MSKNINGYKVIDGIRTIDGVLRLKGAKVLPKASRKSQNIEQMENDPSPEEIARMCEEINADWSEAERYKRQYYIQSPSGSPIKNALTIPVYSISDLEESISSRNQKVQRFVTRDSI